MTTLDSICEKNSADKCAKWHGYASTYEKYFGHLRDEPIKLLEIGTQFGLGLKSFAEYFHRGEMYGVDISMDFKTDDAHIHLFQGDQSNRHFWAQFIPEVQFEIIIDDAGHHASAQKVCFEAMWPRVKPGFWYAIEDVFTWFDRNWCQDEDGGAWLGKHLIGALNGNGKEYHGKPAGDPMPPITDFERSIEYIHCFRGLVILKKR